MDRNPALGTNSRSFDDHLDAFLARSAAQARSARDRALEEEKARQAARAVFHERMSSSLGEAEAMLVELAHEPVISGSGILLQHLGYSRHEDGIGEGHVWTLGSRHGAKIRFELSEQDGVPSLSMASPTARGLLRLDRHAPGGIDTDAAARFVAGCHADLALLSPRGQVMTILQVSGLTGDTCTVVLDWPADGIPHEGYLVSGGQVFRYSGAGSTSPCSALVTPAGEGMRCFAPGDRVAVGITDTRLGRELARVEYAADQARMAFEAGNALFSREAEARFDVVARLVEQLDNALRSTPTGRLLLGSGPRAVQRFPEPLRAGRFVAGQPGKVRRLAATRFKVGRLTIDASSTGEDHGGHPVVVQMHFMPSRPGRAWLWSGRLEAGTSDMTGELGAMLEAAASFMVADQGSEIRVGDWELPGVPGPGHAPPF